MATTTYQVTVGEQTLRVALRRDGDTVYARVGDGEERRVRLDAVQAPLYALLQEDRRVEVLAARMPEATLVAVNGRQYEARVVDEARARLTGVVGASGAGGGRRELKAPMPGLVVKVPCAVGDTVAKGQPLVVLQAMKMENELAAPRDGVIKEIKVAAGQTVEQLQVLVVLD